MTLAELKYKKRKKKVLEPILIFVNRYRPKLYSLFSPSSVLSASPIVPLVANVKISPSGLILITGNDFSIIDAVNGKNHDK
jgi:hypothetical protein